MQARKLSGLFINCAEARDSIFESGKMVFQCLLDSARYSLDYVEIDEENHTVSAGYDFYLFNYHVVTMSWLDTKAIKTSLPGVKITVVLEVSPNDPFVYCSPDDFDAYIVLDPTLSSSRKNVYSFPRPLEVVDNLSPYVSKEVPVIGSFGFATEGKGFEHVIDAVNKEFERAIVRINIPYASYADASRNYAEQLAEICRGAAKNGIEVVVTHDFMSKPDLIEWCGQNTINCFLYDRNMPGLAATTDQAISSGRPLIISKNDTFRHIEKFIKPYPQQTLKEAIENTPKQVAEIQREWSPRKFRERFEKTLSDFQFQEKLNASAASESVILATKNNPQPDFMRNVKEKLAIRTRLRNLMSGNGLTR